MHTVSIEHSFSQIKESYESHGAFSYSERLKLLTKLDELIVNNEKAITQALARDLGKAEFEAILSEVQFVRDEIHFTKRRLKTWMKSRKRPTPLMCLPGHSYIMAEPKGLSLIIGPWNYPFQLLISPLVGSIAAGGASIIKPSEIAVHTSALVKELITQCFEPHEVSVFEGAVELTQELLAQKFDHIFYTGSTKVGRIIMEKAAQNLVPVTLELGGKSPCFIDSCENIEQVCRRVLWGKFYNTGQTCVAPDYILIHKEDKSHFISLFEKIMTEFYPQGSEESDDYGRIINENHFDRLTNILKESIVLKGGSSNREKLYIAPTLVEAAGNSVIMEEEVFGPILPIITIKDFSEVIPFIASRPRPLAAYIFSESDQKVDHFIEKVKAGGIGVNETLMHINSPHLPFGGIGDSGMGSYHGLASFECFTHYKSVMKRSFWPEFSFRFPPYTGKSKLLKRLLRVLNFVKDPRI